MHPSLLEARASHFEDVYPSSNRIEFKGVPRCRHDSLHTGSRNSIPMDINGCRESGSGRLFYSLTKCKRISSGRFSRCNHGRNPIRSRGTMKRFYGHSNEPTIDLLDSTNIRSFSAKELSLSIYKVYSNDVETFALIKIKLFLKYLTPNPNK